MPLTQGGTVILAANAPALADLPARGEVSLLNTVPSLLAELLARDAVPPQVRVVNVAGEPLSAALARQLLALPAPPRLCNLYGPSEDTTYSTAAIIEPGDDGEPAIGRPLPGGRARIVDHDGRLVPAGVPGELLLGGPGVARGYLGRPGLTAARFVPDPWSERPGERLYRTGDRVRSRPDGALEFLGRLDFQVKLRGFRIELGEIESALAALPGVAEAAVLARPDGPQGPWLVAYVAGAAEAALPGLRQALGERLPRHLVPAAFVGLARLPRTPHGKVDRRALPAPTVAGRASGATTTPSQEVLAGLWAQLLGVAVESIGAEADFFALGGQSLLATNLVAQVQAAFGVDLPLRAVFEHPDLAALAEAIDRLLAGEVPRRPELVRVAAAEPVLSFAQERLAFLERLDPTAASYNLPLRFRLRGPIDLRRLDRALSALTARHDALRLGVDHDGAAVLAAATRRPRSTVVDLGAVAAPAALATELARREAHRPFALDRPPLLRAVTLRLGLGAHQLLLSLHHLAADGPSLEVLHQDLARLYEDPGGLPALPFRYLDFAAWQRRCLGAAAIAALCDWWRRELAQAPQLLSLPTDRPRPPFAGATAGQVSFELPAASLAKLDALARQGGATRFMTLLAGLQALLARWSGQADLLVGTPVAGRGHGGLQGLIGLFAGTLVLRGSLVAGDSFHTWLGRVRRRTLAAFAHQDLPFEKLVEVLAPERSLDHAPLFQVLLVLHAALPRGLALPGVAVEVLPSLHRAAKVDLTVAASGGEAGLEGLLEYRADLFDATTMQRFADQLRAWFEAAVAAPERPIETFDLLSPAARQQLMREWNDRGDAAAATTLPALVWAQVARAPQAVAVRCHDEQLSYAELGRRITALAARLAFYGVGAEAKVGLGLTRAAELVVAPLAVHWLGAAYVPIDAELPAERRAFLLADCGARVLVSSPGLAEHWGAFAGEVLRLAGTPAAAALQAPAPAAPDGLAYVLYTSGSTGRPKGVGITQRSLCHLLATIADRPGLAAGERLFAVTALSFDIAGVELFLPLVSGGTVVLATREEAQDGRRLARRVDEAQPDLLQATPATWQLLLDAGWQGGALRAICGGEALLPSLAAALAPRVAALWNLYGPTETTIWSTGLRVAPGREITIGRPLAATTAVVLDRRLQPAALGVPGELWLGGAGLARGYLGRPGLTAERFVPAPGDALPGERFYRTGDLVRSRPGGEIEFLGRIDFQVKVRGYRIELGEIEAALAALPEVAEAAVVPWQPQAGELRLAAYVAGPAEAEVGALRAALAERLPAIMLPAAWTVLPALPRTPNGKLDRRALPPPSLAALAPEGGAPPQGFVEEQLADLWREVLGGESISRDDDFFALGGHSLAAGRLLARLRAALGVELPLRVVFEAPRLAEQARQVADLLAATSLPLAPYPPEVPRRLSFGQERLWVLDRLGAGAVLNVPVGLRITGELDRAALGAALAALLRRQQALRTGVEERDGVALPRLLAARRPTLPLIDLGGLAAEAAEAAASEIAGREANRAFDLRREVPLRCRLLRLGPGQHALLVCLHHIAGDGVSLQIFFDELLAHYQASRARKPAPLAELRVQYGDFALWQRDWLAGELLEEELDYWLRQLAELPGPLPLPFDRPRTAARSWAGASLPLRLDAAACRPLRQLASRQQVTLFTLLLAAFKVLLHGLSGQPDLVVGAPVANRSRLETERLIGFFVNTLVLRSRLSGLGTFADLLASERETVLGALAHQEVPFNLLAQRLGAQPTATANPLFQVGLTFGAAAMAPTASHELAGLSCQPFPIAAERSQFELNLNLSDLGGEIRGSWQYATDLFDRATVEAIAEAFAQVLAAVAGSEDVALTSLAALVAERFARRRQEAAEQLASAASSKLRLARRKPHRVEGDERAPAGSAH